MTRFIQSNFYKGPVPYQRGWKPDGSERYVRSLGTREDDRKAINAAARDYADGVDV
jgi:hypothetical protein